MSDDLPILYSFRRCPYAMRARMAIFNSKIQVELREILLRDKPSHMLQCSEKGTVPVLVLANGEVIDESLDIMYWALNKNDPDNWLSDKHNIDEINELINQNDSDFKVALDKYKYSNRYPELPMEAYREKGEMFIKKLEAFLSKNSYLISNSVSIADVAIFPFVRQFAFVDREWFYSTSYIKTQAWLDGFLESDLFESIMKKHEPWNEGDKPILFL